MLTSGQYTHHPLCPYLISTLQRVVDEVYLPMWMQDQCSGTPPKKCRALAGQERGALRRSPQGSTPTT